MKRNILTIICLLCFTIFTTKAQQLFTQIKAEESGVKFMNIIEETATFNDFTYGYLYNGGGVAVGYQ